MDFSTIYQFRHFRERSRLPVVHDAGGADRVRDRHPQERAGPPPFTHTAFSQELTSKASKIKGQTGWQTPNTGRRLGRKGVRLRLPDADHIGSQKTEEDFDRASRVETISAALYRVPPEFLADPQGVFRTVGRLAARLQIVDRHEWLLFIRELHVAAEFYRANYTAHLPPTLRKWGRIKRLPPYMTEVEQLEQSNYSSFTEVGQ